MFTKTAGYYDALYHFKDYHAACEQLHRIIQDLNPSAKSLLDVGCGTGKHLQHLQTKYEVQGLDLNTELLAIAKSRCPNVVFNEGDMTAFNIGQTFDVVVCLFSSIGYVVTTENLIKTIRQMSNHLNPGGLLLIEPWIFPERYWIDHLTANFVDMPELKIAWMYKSELQGTSSVFDINYMVASKSGIDTFQELHIMGLWTDAEYRNAFFSAGINPIYNEVGLFSRGMYYGVKQPA